nr:uncharacterized protein LOC116651684 [Drosophila virilis]
MPSTGWTVAAAWQDVSTVQATNAEQRGCKKTIRIICNQRSLCCKSIRLVVGLGCVMGPMGAVKALAWLQRVESLLAVSISSYLFHSSPAPSAATHINGGQLQLVCRATVCPATRLENGQLGTNSERRPNTLIMFCSQWQMALVLACPASTDIGVDAVDCVFNYLPDYLQGKGHV